MKLRTKIMMIALLPVCFLGIGIFLLAADRIANGIYDESYAGMEAAAQAVRDIFEVGNPGDYHMDGNGDLWKGDTLNITQSVEIVDHIKNETGMDVTIFWGDTRILTSITNESGDRQVNTKAPDIVVEKVLRNGGYYLDRNVEILGTEYVVCYAPFYQNGTEMPVGMVFLGKPRQTVAKLINEIRAQMLGAIAAVLLVTAVVVTLLVNRIVNGLVKSMGLLKQIAQGDLTVKVEPSILKRSDEVGMLGEEIMLLQDKLQAIVHVLREKSHQLDQASISLNDHSGTVLQLMKGLDQSAQEMSVSCCGQAEDAGRAGSSATQMGEMLGDSSVEIHKMYDISSQIQEMAQETMTEILELNEDMAQVRTSIDYLAKQTQLTKESADKISSATDLIAAVASQTSLLSLNASIEAARAGDLGRGFGVVASEIQKLSVQANDAVDDIRVMTEALTENSNHTIQRMEEVQNVIASQEQNIKKTGQVFEHVKAGIQESVSHMDTVIAKTGDMDGVRSDMVATVQNSAALAQQNAASIEEMLSALESAFEDIKRLSQKTDELGELSAQMKDSVGMFRVQGA